MSARSCRRRWIAGAVLGAVAVALVLALGEYRARYYDRLRQYEQMCTIGRAALKYLRQHGKAPGGVGDLVERGFLHLDESRHATMSSPPGGQTVFGDEAYRVRLSFPETGKGYCLVDGAVISRSNEEPVVLVSCGHVRAELQAYANRVLAREWYSIMATIEGD